MPDWYSVLICHKPQPSWAGGYLAETKEQVDRKIASFAPHPVSITWHNDRQATAIIG